jgi:hypothetical protein
MGAGGSAPQGSGRPGFDPLPDALDKHATKLEANHRRLYRPWAPSSGGSSTIDYWRGNIPAIQKDVDETQQLFDLCTRTIGARAPELAELKAGLQAARRTVSGAQRAFEAPNTGAQAKVQSDSYYDAVDQLDDLAGFCASLANRLRGVHGLPIPGQGSGTTERGLLAVRDCMHPPLHSSVTASL